MTPKEKANEIGNAMYNGSVFDYDYKKQQSKIVKKEIYKK